MDDIKTGSRNNQDDRNRIRQARTLAGQIVDITRELEPTDADETGEVTTIPIKADETVIATNTTAIKATRTDAGVTLGGYLVTFGGADVDGEYFADDTDFGIDETGMVGVYYHHGLAPKFGKRRVSKASLRKDDFGIFAETVLAERDEYERFIVQLAEAGKLGWSSGTAAHLMERETQADGRTKITRWPIAEASLTHTPAEPRAAVMPLKSLQFADMDGASGKEENPASVVETPTQTNDAPQGAEEKTMDITQEQLDEIVNQAATKAAEAAIKAMPPVTDEIVNQAATKAAEAAIKAMPATTPEPGSVTVVKDEADQPFKSAGDFFVAVKNAAIHPSAIDPRLLPLKASGMSEGTPADGGYLVSPTIAGGIVDRMHNTGELLRRISLDRVGPNSNAMTYNAIDETSRVDGSRYGGLQGYWLAEAGSKTASKPAFRQVELKLKKVAALAYATDELLADATALEGWLSRTVPNELRFKVEDAIYNGDGVGKPTGIMGHASLVTQLRYAASTVGVNDIWSMYARRWVGARDYVWLVNQDVLPQLYGLNNTYQNLFIGPSGMPNAPAGTLMGLPIVEVEYAATMGSTGDIMLAALSQYQGIEKGGIESASSIHVQFLTDETVFRFVYRFDGGPMWSSTLTPFKGSNTQSPFVVLAAATA